MVEGKVNCMKKTINWFLLLGILLCMFSAVTYAAGFQTVADISLPLYKANETDKRVSYSEGIHQITIRIHKISESTDEMIVYKDQMPMYQKQIQHDAAYRIYRLQDFANGRFFYAINSNKGNWLMGYDAEKNIWQVYISSTDFYNSVNGNPWLCEKNGDLILSFHAMGRENPTQKYRLFWNSRANWFGYEDLGIYQKQLRSCEKLE